MATRREKRLAQEGEIRETYKIPAAPGGDRQKLVYGLLGAAVLVGVILFFIKAGTPAPFDVTQSCLTTESYHVHPHLSILVDGSEQTIPKGLGIATPTCIRPLHTHETDGVIHVEFEYQRDFTLAEFFKVWGEPYGPDQVWTYKKDATHDLTLTVDGQPQTDWNVILKDQQKIVINYRSK